MLSSPFLQPFQDDQVQTELYCFIFSFTCSVCELCE